MRVLAAIQSPDAIRAILECLGLPARPPPVAPTVLGGLLHADLQIVGQRRTLVGEMDIRWAAKIPPPRQAISSLSSIPFLGHAWYRPGQGDSQPDGQPCQSDPLDDVVRGKRAVVQHRRQLLGPQAQPHCLPEERGPDESADSGLSTQNRREGFSHITSASSLRKRTALL